MSGSTVPLYDITPSIHPPHDSSSVLVSIHFSHQSSSARILHSAVKTAIMQETQMTHLEASLDIVAPRALGGTRPPTRRAQLERLFVFGGRADVSAVQGGRLGEDGVFVYLFISSL